MHEPKNRLDLIRHALNQTLHPTTLTVQDDSDSHSTHSGRGQGGHFSVKIVSNAFQGKTAVQRHQMVYEALGDLMKTDIHAVQIDAKAPD
jgi:BolA family transcriptional regulator, general stress-responsive regulator